VLLIDKDLRLLSWLGRILAKAGFRTVPVTSCRFAERLLAKSSLQVDLVVVNVSLPGSARFMRSLLRNFPNMKVIALLDGEFQPPLPPHAHSYFRKPERDDLKAIVDELEATLEWLCVVQEVLRDPIG